MAYPQFSSSNYDEHWNDHGIVVVPNPASTFIEFQNSKSDIFDVEIFDSTGKLVQSASKVKDSRLDIDLSNGLYFISAYDAKGDIHTARIVIVK